MSVQESAVSSFLASIRDRNLGIVEASDLVKQAKQNVGEFDREVDGIIRVKNRVHLTEIVKEANRWLVPVYPYSVGNNWGYGSKLQACAGILLDLSALNRIVSIDEEQGLARIEPGVTQRQLAEELARRNSNYYLDVTGSGAETSVLGNAIERGVAYGSLRVTQLANLEVLLGNGTVLKTGFSGYPNPALSGLYPYGLGPSIDGLFHQSNLGIVTEGVILLTRKPECLLAISVSVEDDNLTAFMDELAELRKLDYVSGIPHLANKERTVSTMIPLLMDQEGISREDAESVLGKVINTEWTLTAGITGSQTIAREKLKHVKKRIGRMGRIFVHDFTPSWKSRLTERLIQVIANREQRMVLAAAAQLRGFHLGQPSNAGIRFLQNPAAPSVDSSPEGFLLCTPLAPLAGSSAKTFASTARRIAAECETRIAMTLNIVSTRVLEAVISVHFDRSSVTARERAHACVNRMTESFAREGFYPYRVNIDQQGVFTQASPELGKTLKTIKVALDPNGIIAPGRYI